MKASNPIRRVITICSISGILSGLLVTFLFWSIFPSAWLFFIIPAAMGWSINHFAKIPPESLIDEDSFEKIRKQTAIVCAAFVLLFILIPIAFILFFLPIDYIIANFVFYIVCGISVFVGYNRGQQCITDAYYNVPDK